MIIALLLQYTKEKRFLSAMSDSKIQLLLVDD